MIDIVPLVLIRFRHLQVPDSSTTEDRLFGKHVKFDSDGEEEEAGCNNNRVDVVEERNNYTAECDGGGTISDDHVAGPEQVRSS